ncbi:hypothetical protein A2630_00570 [Candidatus Woesebacteria bacterium RIFCSPHIGHO2_01_FULL_44_10]|uniref:Carbamoyl transferase n=1 Tax=Candidatus Woesebacteria bacterium RIFCSPLOWO2_01_FULL_44_14 TaxID=1802525 RepID=A0A1F8C1P4_9BACT|nr:MAG: hypothetical protein A2630_00570 [Candidatus Woesebacteria bacterium RIFCSPHIGHO2_01_FULL_44_10]OGM54381.1 MAG: hypothetical protein A3F62_01355 [Candidatus Woesebacteria bacterium RIFCSPHIGHO2_12_FULL_44_11]OGM70284.1 MAG: hypothetical protein A2975_04405 [Candidatus Woesebacteria bacterium RIFCSPLOWO2_01_FULL_44_14]
MSGYILGITGWFERSHDASACIVKDGKVLVMVEEERFIRKKHAYDKTPVRSISWCLNKLSLTLDDIETVAVGWDYKYLYRLAGLNEPRLNNLADVFFPKKYFSYSRKLKIEIVPHHLAHAASSYFLSGLDEAAILVVDGQGENESTTIARGRSGKIDILRTFSIENSLGYFYEAVSDYIGLGLDSAGKTMGLASYGDIIYEFDEIKLSPNGYKVNLKFDKKDNSLDQQQRVLSAWKRVLIDTFGKQNQVDTKFNPLYGDFTKSVKISKLQKDTAASAQDVLERTLMHLSEIAVNETGIKDLCMAGGVALNCSSNTKVARSEHINSLFIPPNTSDAGVSLGAALLISGKDNSGGSLESAYFGPLYTNSEIKSVLDKNNIAYEYHEDIEDVVAKLLANGKIVSWFQDSLEIGPRALGNRSIVANPTLATIHKKVNEAKNREQWRPLAPSILEESIGKYLVNPMKSPFMLHTFDVKKEVRSKISAIVHVDGSTRPQTVSKKANPRYHKMISKFGKLTGYDLVLNTSFNGSREPIVCSPYDALTSFISNSTDCLAIGNFLVSK